MDVLATAIAGRMSVFDLENLDLAYSPPFGSANDPINTAGFVAGHIARGDLATIAPEDWKPNGEFLLDVRESNEVAESGTLRECGAYSSGRTARPAGRIAARPPEFWFIARKAARLSCSVRAEGQRLYGCGESAGRVFAGEAQRLLPPPQKKKNSLYAPMAVTRRQKEILDFLETFVTRNGYSPSFEEIARGMGLKSLATVHKHITNLERKGMLDRVHNRSRSIDVLPPVLGPAAAIASRLPAASPRACRSRPRKPPKASLCTTWWATATYSPSKCVAIPCATSTSSTATMFLWNAP